MWRLEGYFPYTKDKPCKLFTMHAAVERSEHSSTWNRARCEIQAVQWFREILIPQTMISIKNYACAPEQ